MGGTALAIIPSQANDDEQLVRLWLGVHESESTRIGYMTEWRKLRAYIHPETIKTVTMQDILNYRNYLMEHVSKATVKRSIAATRSLLSFAQRIGYTPFNVGAAVTPPKADGAITERILSRAEVEAMMATLMSDRDRALLATAYETGARHTELRLLRANDIIHRSDGLWQLRFRGKGNKTRHVMISEALASALKGLLVTSSQFEPVFRSYLGYAMGATTLRNIFQEAARKAGLNKRVTPHWFRHTHATHSLDGGCPLPVLQATLGHSSLSTTGIYLHVRPTQSSSQFTKGILNEQPD